LLFTITGKHVDITEAVKRYAEKKVSNLPKYYNSINQVEVVIDAGRGGNVSVEIIARGEHGKIFVVNETDKEVYRCIDTAAHKLEGQIRKKKAKERDNKRAGGAKSV
jgi:putative sigma-54 modulation protein